MSLKNIFGGIFSDKSEMDDDVVEETTAGDNSGETETTKAAKGIFDDEDDTPASSDVKYSPTGALEFSSRSTTPTFSFGEKKTSSSTQTFNSAPKANTTPLYDINSARAYQPKFKLSFISLQDAYDAKNVANLMMAKDTIIVVNISNLEDDQRRRAMDFLDGAKYVSKTVFARFSETMCAFIPSDIELQGDFYGQVEIASFDDKNF